jgi:serine phosphatase RsbU (regulator of sigma subunit)
MKRLVRHIIAAILVLTAAWAPRPICAQPANQYSVDSLILAAKQMPDSRMKLEVLFEICRNHTNVDTVRTYAEQMLEIATQLDDKQSIANANRFIGWCYKKIGNYEKAMASHYSALIIYDALADSLNLAKSYNNTGEDLLELRAYYSADKYLHKSLEIYSLLGLESEFPTIYRNLGKMYRDYKLFETARRYFWNAIEIDSAQNNVTGLIEDYNSLAMTDYDAYHEFYETNSIEYAMQHNNTAYRKAMELNDTSYMILATQSALPICLDYAGILDSAARQHLLDSCVAIYHQTVVYSKALGYTNNFFLLENNRARHLLLNRRYQDCLDHLEMTRKKAENNISGAIFEIDYDCYIDCYAAMGNYKKALEYKKLKDKSETQDYFLETSLNSSRTRIKEEFEQKLRDQEKEKKNREVLFEEHKKMVKIINSSSIIFILLLIVFAIVALFEMRAKQRNNKVLLAQKNEYATQRNILANINIQITDGIRYAKEIQNAIIPSAKIMNSIFGDYLVIWRPLDIVSGNFYWATQKGPYKMLAVGDCLRHGVPGAFTSMLGITSLNDIASMEVIEGHCPSASSMLDKLRNKIENTIPHSDDSGPANMIDIALCIIDTESNTMQFAGAHSPMFIVRNGNITNIKSDDIHIGDNSDNKTDFSNTSIGLCKNDVLYFYTDGIAQQLSSEWEFSTNVLTEMLTLIYNKPFAEQTEYINYSLSKSPKSQEIIDQIDDILLVGIRI